jgi:microcin C transport system substrate-binding protein
MSRFSRRTVLKLGAGLAAGSCLCPSLSLAAERRHGMSLFGDLKYEAAFTHFDYVSPDAPKGGRIVMMAPFWVFNQNPNTFNTLNSFVNRGDAPPRMELTFDSLMAVAADEPDSMYGLVAESVEVADDENEVRFLLREDPRFHDGSALTAEDVAFSLNILKEKGHFSLRAPLLEMVGAEAVGARELVVRFTGKQSRGLKLFVAEMPIFSKAYHSLEENADIEASTLTPALASGPYKVGALSAGRYIEYERVADYWGADLPVNRGRNNFDVIRVEFYRERTAGFEAFKKGEITVREEFTSKVWATEYDFPSLTSGQVVKTTFPGEKRPGVQALYFNTRRPQFSDPVTRRALGLAFDFEWINANLFYGLYERTYSYFQRSQYAAQGLPSAEELALLEPYRSELPEEVFGEPYVPPRSDGSGRDRRLLAEAAQMLKEAGWESSGSRLVREGAPLTAEILINDPVFERAFGVYVQSLRAIGVDASIRLVDPAQYQLRQNEYDFDLVGMALSHVPTPLEDLRSLLTSNAADTPGSHNLAGIRSPVVDALVEKALQAADREAHRTALSAIDRVLRAGNYALLEWNKDEHWVAKWDMFGNPDIKPDFAFPVETTWWFDAEKAERIGKAG